MSRVDKEITGSSGAAPIYTRTSGQCPVRGTSSALVSGCLAEGSRRREGKHKHVSLVCRLHFLPLLPEPPSFVQQEVALLTGSSDINSEYALNGGALAIGAKKIAANNSQSVTRAKLQATALRRLSMRLSPP